MTISLDAHLQGLNSDLLKALVKQLGLSVTGLTRKEHFIQAVAKELAEHLPAVVARMTESERNFLAECAHRGELIRGREFQAKYGTSCPQVTRYWSYNSKDVALLTLFIHTPVSRDDYSHGMVGQFVDPLRALLPEPPAVQARTESALPPTYHFKHRYRDAEEDRTIQVYESERNAPAELSRMLRLIQGGKVKVTDSGKRPTDATARLMTEALLGPDFALDPPPEKRDQWTELSGPVRAHAWGVLVQQCGWAKCRGGALALTPAGQALVRGFDAVQFRLGVDRFVDDDDFDELNRVNHIRGQSGKGKRWVSSPAERKLGINSALTNFPVAQWLAWAEARRLIDASGEFWDVLTGDRCGLYFGELQYGGISHTAGLNSQFLRALFMESFATLGLLDIAYVYPHHLWPEFGDHWGGDDLSFCGRYDGLLYVRVNPLGAYALGITESYEVRAQENPKLFRVLPNLDLVLTQGELNPADRATLELLAVPQSDQVWTLDAECILTHIESGGTFRELQDFLTANAEEGLPSNVQVFLNSLEAKLADCRGVREAVLIEWNDGTLAQLIATSSGTNKLCRHAGGNLLAVAKQDLTAFRRALKKLGYVVPSANK